MIELEAERHTKAKSIILFVGLVFVLGSGFGVEVSSKTGIMPTITPYSCWLFGSGSLGTGTGTFIPCDTDLPCRPLEPCDDGTGSVPLRHTESVIYLPVIRICPGVILGQKDESITIKNSTCEDLEINKWLLASNGSGAIWRLSGKIPDGRQVTISPLNCGYHYPVWTLKVTLYDDLGQIRASVISRPK